MQQKHVFCCILALSKDPPRLARRCRPRPPRFAAARSKCPSLEPEETSTEESEPGLCFGAAGAVGGRGGGERCRRCLWELDGLFSEVFRGLGFFRVFL